MAMGIPVLIIGKSGSGKSRSLKNFGSDEIKLVNVSKKPLPFRSKFNDVILSDDYDEIARYISPKKLDKKTIVIDDAGYLITNMFMRGHTSNGGGNSIFSFYNSLADRFWKMIEYIKTLPPDVITYIIMHEEKNDTGDVKPKTIGKLLDEKVCIEGIFTIVLRCMTVNGTHKFRTKTDGSDVSKSPEDMFEDEYIDNDLKAVDAAIRDYYGL
jgi:hypothetical protein